MSVVKIYTDGSCRGNPGPGGWAAVLLYEHKGKTYRKEVSGGVKSTTNNKMELQAVIEGLMTLKRSCKVEVLTDSQYVRSGLTWAERWKVNGWKTTSRRPVKNKKQWQQLISLCKIHEVNFNWIPAHSEIPENERADRLATLASGSIANNGS